ncbi:MAG: enoyl-CoA hydratase/isomerase family protein [Halieaceae bacterium]|nr:enoyl-CoA hydratase/isomerase family protein [Halieaceae bacterium]
MTDSDKRQAVSCHIDERGIATVLLNRPDRHNAFDDVMIGQLREHFDTLSARADVRVVVLAAEGKSFSAGGDLAWMRRMADYDYEDNLNDARALAGMLLALKTLPQPTLARVQGSAFGGAVGLLCCCDIAIGVDTATFGLTEARVGLIPATIGPHVVEALGPRWARRLFLTAERFDATRARDMGLLHEVCAADELDTRTAALTGQLLANGPDALREAKALCADLVYASVDEALLEDTSRRIAERRVAAEGQEGLKAFLEKRAPVWASAAPTANGADS